MCQVTITYEIGLDRQGDFWVSIDGKPKFLLDRDDWEMYRMPWHHKWGPLQKISKLAFLLVSGKDPQRFLMDKLLEES